MSYWRERKRKRERKGDAREFSRPMRSVIRSQVVPAEREVESSDRKAASFSLSSSKKSRA
jgi:hypothetical protein